MEKIAFVWIFVFSVIWHAEAGIMDRKFSTCGAVILSQRDRHTIPSLSAAETRETFQVFRSFFESQSSFSYPPRNESPAFAHSRSSSEEIDKALGRIRGVLGEGLPDEDLANNSDLVLGSVYKGWDEIEGQLEARKDFLSQMSDSAFNLQATKAKWVNRLMLSANLVVWVGTFLLASNHLAEQPILVVSVLGALPLAVISLFEVPERILKDVRQIDLDQDFKLSSFVNVPGSFNDPNGWIFHSFDAQVDEKEMRKLMATGDPSSVDYFEEWNRSTYPRSSHAALLQSPIMQKLGVTSKSPALEKETTAWFRVEQLFRMQDGTPELAVLIRFSKQRTRYPKTSNSAIRSLLELLSPERELAPVPIRR